MPRSKESVAISTVIGIRGSFTIRIERSPIKVNKRDERIIIEKVHKEVLKINFEERNLLKATIVVKNKRGTTTYLPICTTKSFKNAKTEAIEGLSKGRINATTKPIAIPIKYFTQTFIYKALYHKVDCLSRLCYNVSMYNILLIGKELPDSLSFCESLKENNNQIFTSAKTDAEAIQFEAENIYATTWNKASAVSARTFLIKAENKLEKIDHVIFYFDAAFLTTKFDSDRSEELSSTIDQLINSYLFTSSELLKRLEQKQEAVTVTFLVREYPSKYELSTSSSKGAGLVPASSIVSIAQAAFMAMAEHFSTCVNDHDYLSVILAKCPFNNELFKSDKALAQWLLECFASLSQAKHRQTVKQAGSWNKAGSKLASGFSLFK